MIRSLPKYITYTDESASRDTPLFVLHEETDIFWDDGLTTKFVTLPVGFTTDFGSVPKPARAVISNVSCYDPAYLLHDWMFSTLYVGPDVTFHGANTLLRKNLGDLGMPAWQRFFVYWAVELGGKSRWRVTA
jgi:hypothetical protein